MSLQVSKEYHPQVSLTVMMRCQRSNYATGHLQASLGSTGVYICSFREIAFTKYYASR